ncbi:sugar O-acetyltransferase [Parabacteroides massiliensis]|uniref:sugar O-acetyltransferase n=1 Tax=Parabacteroides massiliensis TaxID=1750560 RepID=UPI00096A3B87|nr:sugar O-acetyltransferase [Parabacteroides massiliensis]
MKTELEKCLAGEVFNGGDKELATMALNAKRLLKELNNTDYADVELKRNILQKLFGKIGENVHLDIDFHCEYGKHIFVGNQVVINMNCTFVDNNIIEIGNNVLIASNVQLYTATHSTKVHERIMNDEEIKTGICKTYALPIKICDGAWIGGGSIVLPGVTIGKNSVIGAGSVVTRSIPDNCVAVGNPCRVIKYIDNEI